ncbi:nucleolar protein 12 [Harpegnathos saltator]|uniref:nucleolar protein 12 n=1 Tax=Harpegnathos saltator TaxID=610380 RepID=UPI00058F66CA|nr:nucleolar protein 12 [Harpegnathos saltator]XP_011154975.1 nucleolar protein 12 [Harpegnathos saltator]
MAKTSSGQNITSHITKKSLCLIKNGSVKKYKKPKFKNTPTGKVTLIDDMKAKNKNTPQKNFQKLAGVKDDQNLFKGKLKQLEGKENSPKEKQILEEKKTPKGKQIPKRKQIPNESQNKQSNKKINVKVKKELGKVSDSDSDSDIDEGIVPQEEISIINEVLDEEESDADIPDIFGASLGDDSDVDDSDVDFGNEFDEDFEDEEEEEDEQEEDEDSDDSKEEEDDDDSDEETTIGHLGIKMFKGIKSNTKHKNLKTSEEDDDDDDDDEDEDEGEENDTTEISIGGNTSAFESNEDDDDDVKDDDEDESEDEVEDKTFEDEEESTALGLKALLGKTMTDDDDEDFDEEDDDYEDDSDEEEDENDSDEEEDEDNEDDSEEDEDGIAVKIQEKSTKTKVIKSSTGKDASEKNEQAVKKSLSPEEQEEVDRKTIFIDNIPKETKITTLKKVFGQYGPIDNLRFRNIVPKNPKISKKVAAIKQDIHPKIVTVVAYIKYKSEESAKKALSMNGKKFEGNYVNVKIVAKLGQEKHNIKKSIFIGNLKFGMNTNDIWENFSKCGEIESVRLIRDKKTGQTRGFGYVNFKSEDAVTLALKLDGVEINNRPVRVRTCRAPSEKSQKSNNQKKEGKRILSNENNDNRPLKKFKNSRKTFAVERPTKEEAKDKQKKSQKNNTSLEGKISKSFQGQQADMKDKKKGSKFNKKKKEIAGKLIAKSKKQKA